MYYPSSQITPNLTTNGGEFTISSTQEEYSGFYFKTSSGQFYTGKTPQSPPNLKLSRIISRGATTLGQTSINPNFSTNNLNLPSPFKVNNNIKINSEVTQTEVNYNYPNITNAPISSIPSPTEEDYNVGEFQRYFLKKRNEMLYIEVNKTTYNNYINRVPEVQWVLYLPIQLPWDLIGSIGEVYTTNKNIVGLKETNLGIKGFMLYFKDNFTRYYKSSKDENLYTSGGEFINKKTRVKYIGFYYISQDGKIMAGKQGPTPSMDVLIPIDQEVGTSRRPNVNYNINALKKRQDKFGNR